MRGLKAILGAAVVASALFLIPSGPSGTASAQISFSINLGAPPACRWGYFDYPPYRCAPYGYYGPGYFYNGIFLGVGPWHEWGYSHGWGGHRFVGARGGHYVPYSHGDFRHGNGHPDDHPWHGDDHRGNGYPNNHGGPPPQHMQGHPAPQSHGNPHADDHHSGGHDDHHDDHH